MLSMQVSFDTRNTNIIPIEYRVTYWQNEKYCFEILISSITTYIQKLEKKYLIDSHRIDIFQNIFISVIQITDMTP